MVGPRSHCHDLNEAWRQAPLGNDQLGIPKNHSIITRFYMYASHRITRNMSFVRRKASECSLLATNSGYVSCIKVKAGLGLIGEKMELEPDFKGNNESKYGKAVGVTTTGSFATTNLDVSSLDEEQRSEVIDIFQDAIANKLELPARSTVTVLSINDNGIVKYEIVVPTESSAEESAALAANSVSSSTLSQELTWESIIESAFSSSSVSSDSSVQNAITAATRIDSHTAGGSRNKKVWSKEQIKRGIANRLKSSLSNFDVVIVHRTRADEITEPGRNSIHMESDVYYFAKKDQKGLFVSNNLEAVKKIKVNNNPNCKDVNKKLRAR